MNAVQARSDNDKSHLLDEATLGKYKNRGRSAQDPPNPSRRLFCSDAISDEDIDRTGIGSKCNGRAPTGISFIAHMVDVGNML